MALKGTLKDFGIADIFQLIGQQQKTGVLHLKDRDDQVNVAFKDGNVVRAENVTRKRRELLGSMLVRAGLVSERQLEEALEEQKRTLKRLGDILIATGAISRDSLREMAQLQTTETLYKLFAWKSGDYEFEVAEVDFDPGSITPVRSESVLMEGFRRVDEWPMIRKKITSTSMTFTHLKELGEKPAGSDDLDSALDDAFGEFEGGKKEAPEEREFKSVGPNERLVFSLAEPGRDVQSIVDRSRLGEFEACKALLNLVNLGYLKPMPPSSRSRGTEVGAVQVRWTDRLVKLGGVVSAASVLLGVGTLFATRVDLERLATGSAEHRCADPAVKRLAGRAQQARIETALATYVLEKGALPEKLGLLVEEGILSEADLRYPWREAYHYRRTGDATYVLLPPTR